MRTTLALAFLAVAGIAGAQTLSISFGTRETGTSAAIGGNGGTSGSIEWIDMDTQTLLLDDTWQVFRFDMDAVPVTAFTGNGVLDGAAGTLEHIRIRNTGGVFGPLSLWIDDVTDTIDTGAVNFGTFEGYSAGDEVMFQEPNFSGSTSGNLLAGGTTGVDTTVARTGDNSLAVNFEFVDTATTRWLRLTSFNATNQPNSAIRYDQNSVVSFWMKGAAPIPEPASVIALGLGASALLARRRRKKAA